MQVYLDTNILWKDFALAGSRLQPLLRNARGLGLTVVLPEVVVMELVAQYRDALDADWGEMRRAARRLQKLLPTHGTVDAMADLDINRETELYRQRFEAQLNSLGIRVAPVPGTSHEALLRRDLARRLPFRRIGDGKDHKGTVGYRDALIWETVLADVLVNPREQFVLISANKDDFAHGANTLHPTLVEDLVERGSSGASVWLYTSLQDFIDEHVTGHLEAAEEIRLALQTGEVPLAGWLKEAPLRLGGAEAFDLSQFGITGFQVVAIEQVLDIRELEISVARRLSDGSYVEGVAWFDLRLITAVDVAAFAAAAGLDAPTSDAEGRLSGADDASILADFSGTISTDRVPQSVTLTKVWLLDPTSSLGELQPNSLAGQGPSVDELRRLVHLRELDLFPPRLSRRLDEIIARADYTSLSRAQLPPVLYAGRVVSDLGSHNWSTQNSGVAGLRSLGREGCAQLEAGAQEDLGRNVLQAADGDAYRAQGFMRELLAFQLPWPRPFVEGLLLEGLVNERMQFRCKAGYLPQAVSIAASHPDAESVFERAARDVRASTPKSNPYLASEDFQAARAALEHALANIGDAKRPLVEQLLSAVAEAEVEARARGRVRDETK